MDFAKIVEEFDRHGVSFVAVTQQFNMTTSMGRLTLNVLLSFAQFEREVTTERIRDKIAASKRKGMWMGGNLPLGYDVAHRKLVVNREEAKTVKLIYQRYLELGCVRLLQQDLEKQGIRSKARVSREGRRSGGHIFSRGALYTLLANPIYVGEVRHKTVHYKGQHEPILDRDLWQKVQQQLKDQGTARKGVTGKSALNPLAGKLFDANGNRLIPSHTVKSGRRYRYYISEKLVSGRAQDADRAWRLPASEIETALAAEVARVLGEPATITELVDTAGARRQTPALLQRIETAVRQLNSDDTRAEALATFVYRVAIDAETVGIEISVASLLADEGITGESDVIEEDVSLKLSRRGGETRLIIGGIDRRPARSDPALVKLVARARNWWDTLAALNGVSLEQMAVRVKLPERYFSKMLQLAFLAPSIVEDIVAGRHPRHVGRQLLIDTATLPISWHSQKTLLGWTE